MTEKVDRLPRLGPPLERCQVTHPEAGLACGRVKHTSPIHRAFFTQGPFVTWRTDEKKAAR